MKQIIIFALLVNLIACKEKSSPPDPTFLIQKDSAKIDDDIESMELLGRSVYLSSKSSSVSFTLEGSLNLSKKETINRQILPILSQNGINYLLLEDRESLLDQTPLEDDLPEEGEDVQLSLAAPIILFNPEKNPIGAATQDNNTGLIYTYLRGMGLLATAPEQTDFTAFIDTQLIDSAVSPRKMIVHRSKLILLDFDFGIWVFSLSDPLTPRLEQSISISDYNSDIVAVNSSTIAVSTARDGIKIFAINNGSYRHTRTITTHGAVTKMVPFNDLLYVSEKISQRESYLSILNENDSVTRPIYVTDYEIENFSIGSSGDFLVSYDSLGELRIYDTFIQDLR